MADDCFGEGPFVFRLNENGNGPQLLAQVCQERGWKEYNHHQMDQNDEQQQIWNLWWKSSGFPIGYYKHLYNCQFINHYPKGSTICRKDNLARFLKCMKKVYGSVFDFSPHCFNMPLEYTKLVAECNEQRSQHQARKNQANANGCGIVMKNTLPIWIYKPVSKSQGRGIFLFRELSELNYDTNAIVQRYIESPFLIGGYKFDLRLYVCVPSYHPVTIYMYNEGLVRFGTDKFNLDDLENPFRHLTNSSLNKFGPGYQEVKDRVGSGCKWTLQQLRKHFRQSGISDWLMWQRICSLVILTVLSHVSQVPSCSNCFEFFGFDVLVDSTLRPWLLEVNLSPGLSYDCDADIQVKKPMLHDLFDLLGLPIYNTGLSIYSMLSDFGNDNHHLKDKRKKSASSALILAANKWRQKKNQADNDFLLSAPFTRTMNEMVVKNSSSNCKAKSFRRTAGENHQLVKSVNFQPGFPPQMTTAKKQVNKDFKSRHSAGIWGNGKDWNVPSAKEGGWTRLWPMDTCYDTESKTNIKMFVSKIIKFNKTAREIVRKHQNEDESTWNRLLQEKLELTTDIWLPLD